MNLEHPPWRAGDATSRFLTDLAAGRRPLSNGQLSTELLQLAQRHGLLGELAHSPDRTLRSFAVPLYLLSAGHQRIMKAALHRVLVRLWEGNVPVAVLKGPYVALSYRNPAVRSYTDLDLLVRREDLSRALKIIEADQAVERIPPKRPRADKRDVPFRDPSGVAFNLDLHWDMFSYTQLLGCAEGATEWAWEQAVPDPDHELGPLWHLPKEAQLAFLSTHATLDHRFRLILFRDLAEVARAGVDWQRLIDFTRQWKLRSWTYLALRIARDVAEAPVPNSVLKELRPSTLMMKTVERLLQKADLVYFDGHSPHLLNLGIVLLHDSLRGRVRLAARAPVAFPLWLRRVEGEFGPLARRGPRRHLGKPLVRPSRVLHVLPLDIARGAQTYAKALREALDSPEVEHRTAIIFRSDPGSLDADVDLGVADGIGRRLGFSIRAMLRLGAYIRRQRPDVVVAHGGEALKYVALVTPSSTKIAYYKIGTAHALLRNPLRRAVHRSLLRRAHLVVGVSSDMVTESQTLLGGRPERTVLIPNGRDPSQFVGEAESRSDLEIRFVSVGLVDRLKRPNWFIDVVATLQGRGINAVGWMVGVGPKLEALKEARPPGILFFGHRDDVPTLLRSCDVFLLTSMAEGMPGVIIEAGLAGLPTVTTDVAGAREVVEDGLTGFVIGLNDKDAFVSAAERLARDPELRSAMGTAARARCADRFTLESSIDLWRGQLARMLAEASR